jgi:hypothetical protein
VSTEKSSGVLEPWSVTCTLQTDMNFIHRRLFMAVEHNTQNIKHGIATDTKYLPSIASQYIFCPCDLEN